MISLRVFKFDLELAYAVTNNCYVKFDFPW